ncbi:MAG TPA: hypothetical protein VGC96_03555 [Candidatus Elarobacter sp.]|jgi:hypothetical protein
MTRLIALLCLLVVVLDAVESVIARSFGVPYAWFMLLQIVVYVAIGFVLRRAGLGVRDVVVAGVVTALVDGTLGEWVAVSLGGAPVTPLAVQAVVVPIAIVIETLLALGGFALGSIGRAARS